MVAQYEKPVTDGGDDIIDRIAKRASIGFSPHNGENSMKDIHGIMA